MSGSVPLVDQLGTHQARQSTGERQHQRQDMLGKVGGVDAGPVRQDDPPAGQIRAGRSIGAGS